MSTQTIQSSLLGLRRLPFLKRIGWQETVATIAFLVISSFFAYWGHGENSVWTRLTMPTEVGLSANTLLGYSTIYGSAPFFKENISPMYQTVLFAGATFSPDNYFVRGFYPFVVAFVAPLVGGVISGMLVVNFLCWCISAWVGWRFTLQITESKVTALLCVIFIAFGMGMIIHIGDYSAHLMSFTFYFVGILLVYESKVWKEQRPLSVHLAIGFFLALACLAYNTGIELTLGYLVISARRNRWQHLVIAAVVAFSATGLWVQFMNFLNFAINHQSTPYDFYAIERSYLQSSLAAWINIFSASPLAGVRVFIVTAAAFLEYESPFVIALGLIALLFLKPQIRLFFLVFLLLPIAGGLVYALSATARSYISYGTSLLIYCGAAGILVKGLNKRAIWRTTSIVLIAVVIGSQLLWNTAIFVGNWGPAKVYFFGVEKSYGLLLLRPVILSMTGQENTPALFGGTSTLAQAGLLESTQSTDVIPSFAGSLLARSFLILYVMLFFLLVLNSNRQRVVCLVLLAIVYVASSWLTAATLHSLPNPTWIETAVPVQSGSSLKYQVEISDQLLKQFQARAYDGAALEFFVPISFSGKIDLHVLSGDRELNIGNHQSVPLADFVDAMRQSRTLTLLIDTKADTIFPGWQRIGLAKRTFEMSPTGPESTALPVVELRLYSANGFLLVDGF